MTIVRSSNGVNEEVLQSASASIVTATVNTQDLTLERGGVFLGGSVSPFVNAASLGGVCMLTAVLTKTDDTVLAYGDVITQVRVKVRNDSGGNRTVSCYVRLLIGV